MSYRFIVCKRTQSWWDLFVGKTMLVLWWHLLCKERLHRRLLEKAFAAISCTVRNGMASMTDNLKLMVINL